MILVVGVEVALAESQTKDEYDGRPLIFLKFTDGGSSALLTI